MLKTGVIRNFPNRKGAIKMVKMKNLVGVPKRFNNFLKSYWLAKPSIGVRKIAFFYLMGLLVLLLGIILREYLLIFICLISLVGMTIYFCKNWRNFGFYHRLEEFEDLGESLEIRDFILPKNPRESRRELLVKGSEGFYSHIFLDEKRVDSSYFDICRLLASLFFPKGPKRSLFLGGGGCAVPLMLAKSFPEAELEVAEVSPIMINIAERYFSIPTRRIKFFNQDAFEFVKNSRCKYDFIFVDIFVGNRLPETILESEFINSLEHLLSRKGIIVVNSGRDIRLALGIFLKKLRKVFKNVYPLMIERKLVFLICRRHYTKTQLSKLSQKARFKKEIKKLIDANWFEI